VKTRLIARIETFIIIRRTRSLSKPARDRITKAQLALGSFRTIVHDAGAPFQMMKGRSREPKELIPKATLF
jgi:hypothetical protein